MKNLTWQNPEQLFVAQVLINKVKSKCCGIKVILSLLEVAGVNEITAKTENRGGKVETYKFKKYDLIGFHTARRSFASNMFLAGKPTYAIMQLTGHTNERTFYKYVKATPEQIAKLLDFNSIG